MLIRPFRTPARALGAALALPLVLAGCLSPSAAEPVAQSTLRHALAVQSAHAQDLLALRAATVTLLAIQRERLLTDLHIEFIARWTTDGAEPDPESLDTALADPDDNGALVADIRHGRLSRDDAAALIADFCVAEALSNFREARRALLAQLGPIVRHDADASAVLAALDARAAQAASLHNELLADAGAITLYTQAEPALDDLSRAAAIELWTLAVTNSLNDPAQRYAAQRLLHQLLALGEQ